MKDERSVDATAASENEALLRAFFDSPGALRAIVELVGKDILVLSTNVAQAVVYGRTTAELRSVLASRLGVPRPMINFWRQKFELCQKINNQVTFEYSTDFRAPGTWARATVTPIGAGPGGRPRFGYVSQDITEQKQAERLLQIQRDMGVRLSSTADLDVALKHLLGTAEEIEGFDSVAVYLVEPENGAFKLAAHSGLTPAFVQATAHLGADTGEARLIREGQPVFTRYNRLVVRMSKTRRGEGLRAIAMLPLCDGKNIFGALVLSSHLHDDIPAPSRAAVEAIAAQAGGAISRIRAEIEQHRLEIQILDISDCEQARIGQDIHDGLCQNLVSLAFDVNALEHELASQKRPESALARRIADHLDQAITESRQLSRGLFPVRLLTEGLEPALRELAESTRERFQISCRLTCGKPVKISNSTIVNHLYRIAQEAVTNAVKHGRAEAISISLRTRADRIEMRIEDNGIGLEPKTSGNYKGLGLHIMKYRARSIGATFCLGPGRRGGTLISCWVPFPTRSSHRHTGGVIRIT